MATPAARATASVITPASAPWRSSPPTSLERNRCSAAVAAEQLGELSAPYAGRAGPAGPFHQGERSIHVAHFEGR